jgi:hypothetical protein
MKVKVTVDIEEGEGETVADSTMIEVNVPDFGEFTNSGDFGEVFKRYEQDVLLARNKAIEVATEKYLSALAKKKPKLRQRCERAQSLKDQRITR